MYQSGLDDLHYINRGIAKIIIDALSTKKYTNNNTQQIPNIQDRIKFGDKLHHYIYPFTLKHTKNDDKLIDYINKEVRDSKKFIPPYTAGGYIGLRGGNPRAVDYEDVFFRVIPTAIVPPLVCPEAQQALRALLLANTQLDVMERAFSKYTKFLKECVDYDTLDISIFTVTNHYSQHVPDIIKNCGPLGLLSSRCLERQIGVIKAKLKSRSDPGINSQNVCLLLNKAYTLRRIYPDWQSLILGEDKEEDLSPTNDTYNNTSPPFALVSPFKYTQHTHLDISPRVVGPDTRKKLELIPITDILHIVVLQHTVKTMFAHTGSYNTVNSGTSLEAYEIFWPRSSIGVHLNYPFRPSDDDCAMPPIPSTYFFEQ